MAVSALRIIRTAAAIALAGGLAGGLVACVPGAGPSPSPTGSAPITSDPLPTPTPTPTKPPPVLYPSGTATQNLPYFNYINEAGWNNYGFTNGISYVDALTAAGFNRADMELTWWDTPDGHLADSIFFSVRFGEECLIGQIAEWGYAGQVLPVLATGMCMVGDYQQPIP